MKKRAPILKELQSYSQGTYFNSSPGTCPKHYMIKGWKRQRLFKGKPRIIWWKLKAATTKEF